MRQMEESEIRKIEWDHVESDCVHSNVWPQRLYRETTENEDGSADTFEDVAENGVSEAYGTSTVRGVAPDGKTLDLVIEWASSGKTDGGFADLYDWDSPEINEQGQSFPVALVQGVAILDEDGDELTDPELADLLLDVANENKAVWEGHARATLPEEPDPEDVDNDEGSDMETITLPRDNQPDLRFKGEEIAETDSFSPVSNNGRWTILRLYKTAGGKYVCQQVGRTQWQGETDRHNAEVCETTDEVIGFFGHGWLAKDLYENAGIEDIEVVD